MRADLHVHTRFSCDSEAQMCEYLRQAEEKKVDWICFTDHVDDNKNDYGYGYYKLHEFFEEIHKVKENANGITICTGIDFPKRYYKEIYYEEQMIAEIFKEMLEKNIVMEINTSSLRKGLDDTMPSKEILEIYKDNGGKYVTIGSDAHEEVDLAAGNDRAKRLVSELGLQEVVYRERKKVI